MTLLSTLANTAWWAANTPAYLLYKRALTRPAETQRALLSHYLRTHADTAFGRAHRLALVRTPDDFRRAVPLHDYDDLAPYIDRITRGQPNVLTASPVTRLVPSSGSTRAAKLIPYTRDLQREFNRGIAPWIFDLFRNDPSLAAGPAYWSISPATPPPSIPSAIPVGFDDDSAYLSPLLQPLVASVLAVPSAVRHLHDLDTFRYATLLSLLRRPDLRLISLWHPSYLPLLLSPLEQWWNQLLSDLSNGTFTPPFSPSSILHPPSSFSSHPQPHRAASLRHTSPHDYASLWPHLRLISCWTHAHAAPAAAALQKLFPRVPLQPKGLLATEAFVSLPFQGAHPLAVRSHFFEFLDDAGHSHLAHELNPGHVYSVVITTAGGLWRYRLRDRVRVTGHLAQTPSLEFLSKEGHVVDLAGEKLSDGFVASALAQLPLSPAPVFAMLAPDLTTPAPSYTLFLQLPPDAPIPASLASDLDAALRANPHYAYCRHLGQLAPPRLFLIPHSAHQTYLTHLRSHGQRLGDIKPTPLHPLPTWSEVFNGRYS